MYIFVSGYYAGIDFVYTTHEQGFSEGDLIAWGDVFGVCLGNNVSFVERYEKERLPPCKVKNIKKSLFSKEAMQLVHWMVEERFTTYRKVVPLFLPKQGLKYLDISQYPEKTELEKQSKNDIILSDIFEYDKGFFTKTSNSEGKSGGLGQKRNGQQLFVFPDLRTLYNSFDESFFEESGVKILYSSMTDRQKMLAFNDIKSGRIHTLLATSSEIFQDRKDLQYISFVDSYKWYYDSFQDPRYKVGDVLNKTAEIYGIKVNIYEV